VSTTGAPVWTVDGEGYIHAPSGIKAAKIVDGVFCLYDKKTHEHIPFTLEDLFSVTMTQIKRELTQKH
jgi:hypothetical protein